MIETWLEKIYIYIFVRIFCTTLLLLIFLKAVFCPIDPRLNYHQANKLIKDISVRFFYRLMLLWNLINCSLNDNRCTIHKVISTVCKMFINNNILTHIHRSFKFAKKRQQQKENVCLNMKRRSLKSWYVCIIKLSNLIEK